MVKGVTSYQIYIVRGKGGKVRSVPVDASALEVLRCRANVTRRGCKLFVPDGVKTDTIMRGLEQFIIYNRNDDRDNGVHLTVHGLRHTWAAERYRELIASGQMPYEARRQVSRWLGHERDSVTKIYLASLKNDKKGGGKP